jgi:hypothetical protein
MQYLFKLINGMGFLLFLFGFARIPCPAFSGIAGMIGLRLRLHPDKMARRTTAKLVRAKTGYPATFLD